MSGDINAINSWARSTAKRAVAIAQNTGICASDAKAQIIRADAAAKRLNKQRTGK